jgi:hypothetical protein
MICCCSSSPPSTSVDRWTHEAPIGPASVPTCYRPFISSSHLAPPPSRASLPSASPPTLVLALTSSAPRRWLLRPTLAPALPAVVPPLTKPLRCSPRLLRWLTGRARESQAVAQGTPSRRLTEGSIESTSPLSPSPCRRWGWSKRRDGLRKRDLGGGRSKLEEDGYGRFERYGSLASAPAPQFQIV